MSQDIRKQGTVKWFNAQKGYGFINYDGSQDDIFVHISAVEAAGLRALQENQRLSFEVKTDTKGRRDSAVALQLL